MEYFPANTLTNFKTKLVQPVELIGDWEVALAELQYPHNWYNLRNLSNHIYRDSAFDKKEVLITKNTEAALPVDLEAGIHAMYLYTDIVEPQLVGDSKFS